MTEAEKLAETSLPLDRRLLLAAHTIALGNSSMKSAAQSMEWGRSFLALGMQMLNDALDEVGDEALKSRPPRPNSYRGPC
jgi:hypothetical protein